MVVKGSVIGYQIFQSGAAQIFVACEPSSTEKIKEVGTIVRSFWRAKGTYNPADVPDLMGATVIGFVGRDSSGIIDILPKKGGVK